MAKDQSMQAEEKSTTEKKDEPVEKVEPKEEATTKEEKTIDKQASQSGLISKKNKKINKLSLDEINKKIEELDKTNQIHSKYYLHLVQRRNELQE